ncbi:MAG: hypothetical protein IT301_17165 [Dehalococcoidia bacterium]|nr:hypothetical protein [Dehalococcoidia bacterium]
MNLFRSEEHAKAWSRYEPDSEDGILPLADWARIFSGPLFRERLREDYLSRRGEGMAAFMQAIASLGKQGEFWRPG